MAKKHTDTIQRMLDRIAAEPGVRTAALADAFDMSTNEVSQRLKTAIDAGLVVVCLVKQPTGHPQNEYRISTTAPCADGKAPDWSAFKAARRAARNACDTPAGGGEISPAPRDLAPSVDHASPGARGVVEPPEPAKAPARAGSDVKRISLNTRNGRVEFDGRIVPLKELADPEDDTDPHAFPRSRRMIHSCSSDGIVQLHRKGDTGLVLTPDEADALLDFLTATKPVWGAAA